MLYRVTNDQKQPRVIYDASKRARLIMPGQQAEMDLDDATAEFVWERALAGVGPKLEKLPPKAKQRVEIPEVVAEAAPEQEEPKRKKRGRPRKQKKQQQPADEVW